MANQLKMIQLLKLIFIIVLFASCNQSNNSNNNDTVIGVELDDLRSALNNGDSSIESTEFFKHSGFSDSVYETESGIVMVVPKGAFIDPAGNIVEDEIVIELAEIKTIEDFLRAKLSEYKDVIMDKSERMVYINATSNGDQLSINQDSPVYLEFPTSNKKDLFVFKGIRDSVNRIRWINSEKSKNYLVLIDQELFNYLPSGFEEAIVNLLPINNHDSISKELIDSIFYALTPYCEASKDSLAIIHTIGNLEDTIAVKMGQVRSDTIYVDLNDKEEIRKIISERKDVGRIDYIIDSDSISCMCLNTSSVKAILSPEFKHTYLSTREFQNRLQNIYKSGSQKVLDFYINNLTEDLYKSDSFAFEQMQSEDLKQIFKGYKEEELTNVKGINSISKKLSEFYNRKLKAIESELSKNRKEQLKSQHVLDKQNTKKVKSYNKLLEKRLEYRMDKFGFELKQTGWYNIKKQQPKDLPKFHLNITVENGKKMDEIYTYFVQPSINSIYALETFDKIHFHKSVGIDSILISQIGNKINILSIGYWNDSSYFSKKSFLLDNNNDINLLLTPSSNDSIHSELKSDQRGYKRINKILVDLEYQREFYNNKKKKEDFRSNEIKMNSLLNFVDNCDNLN